MKKYLLIIKYTVLLFIIVGLLLLVYFKKNGNNEAFQDINNFIKGTYFDLNTNYNSFEKDEDAANVPVDPDTIILDIGGAFGQVDLTKIPWDSENKELTQSETLWGIVPRDPSIALFKKIYLANQLDDINSLPVKDNDFYYEDPMIMYGTDNRQLSSALQAVNGLSQFLVPLVFGHFIGDKIEDAARESLKNGIKSIRNSIRPAEKIAGEAAEETAEVVSTKLKKSIMQRLRDVPLNNVVKPLQKGGRAVKETASLFKQAAKAGVLKEFTVEVAKAVYKSGIFKKAIMNIVKTLALFLKNLVTKALVVAVVAGGWLDIVAPGVGAFFNFVITPLLLILSLPEGPVTKALDKWADSEGPCPPNSIPLDEIIPQWAMMLISFIPILGDILDLVYPYVCSQNGTGLLIPKSTLSLPKYIDYPWLSSYFWNWPEYNGRAQRPIVQGKYLATQLDQSISFRKSGEFDLYTVSHNWDYGPYLNFDEILIYGNTNRYDQINKKLEGFKPVYTTDKFFPNTVLPSGAKFFYADFSDPTMLVQMGQFYYDFSLKNPVLNDDKTISIEIISKINHVIASSLYTCDIECEILHVTYDPSNGTRYNEYITLSHDRRFYFGVDYNANAQPYWENRENSEWVTLDDKLDSAMYNLKEYLHRYNIFRPSEDIEAKLFVTAYEQKLKAQNIFNNVISNSSYSTTDYNFFNNNLTIANTNYNRLINYIILPNAASVDPQYRERLDYRVSTVVGIKDELWDLQKRLRPVAASNISPQYKIYGCTHIDETAGAALPADVSSLESDNRKKVDFNILPYLKRCNDTFINTNICNDISNVEQVVKMYKEKYPNKHIKSILNIKAQGKNMCEFTWNEVTTGQNNETEKKYKILYQTDLSSCTFCLPNTLIADGSSELPAIESIKMYKNPIDDPISQEYNPDYNTRLSYRKAFYYKPTVTYSGPTSNIRNVTFETISNIDTIPRYDPNTLTELPELVRPKKPIRITYPKPAETHLFKGSNDICSNPDTLQKFILDYNKQNPTNKILSIIRAFTSSSNSCDLEVDILIKNSSNDNKVQRKTLSFNMKEGFENIYTYDSLKNSDGLNITKNTSNLENPYSENGVTFGKPYLNEFNPTIISNVSYFNNDLVTNYTTNTKEIVGNARDLLVDLKGAQYLGNDSTNCKKKCEDPEIMQRIMEQYNLDNQTKGRFNQEKDTMDAIFKAATDSADRCHLYFAQNQEYYADKYSNNINSSNNYIKERNPALRRVAMKQLPGTCDFVPIAGQQYIDISASDLALQANINDSNFFYPSRESCTNLNCTNRTLLNQAIRDYESRSGSRVTSVLKTLKVSNDTCDYNIIQDLNYQGDLFPDIEGVLRVKYNYPVFRNSSTCGNFTYSVSSTYDSQNYVSDTFELQFAGNLDDSDPNTSAFFSFMTTPTGTLATAIQDIS